MTGKGDSILRGVSRAPAAMRARTRVGMPLFPSLLGTTRNIQRLRSLGVPSMTSLFRRARSPLLSSLLPPGQGPALDQRCEYLYRSQLAGRYQWTDRLFAVLLILQWVAGMLVALWITPRT